MAPRRGGSSFSFGGYDSDSPWDDEVYFSLRYAWASQKSLLIAEFVFYVLSLIAFLVFLVWACLLRSNRVPRKGLLLALFFSLLTEIMNLIYPIFYFADAHVKQYHVIVSFLDMFFSMVSFCLTFYVFWSLVHRFLERLTDSGRPYAAVNIVHWALLGLTVLLSIAEWGLYVAFRVRDVQDGYSIGLVYHYTRLDAARFIIFWLFSLEILAWSIFVIVKAGSHRFQSKMPVLAFIVGCIFWFALNLMYIVIAIRYILDTRHLMPRYTTTARSVVEFFFNVAMFVAVLFCCSNWRKLGDELDKPLQQPQPVAPAAQFQQFPYGSAPYQPYQQPHAQTTYAPQGQQAYPQQQPTYPVPQQQAYPQQQQAYPPQQQPSPAGPQ
ncbi:hypothetical protein NUU61_004416 [Penicillium alfredii]|uniref:Uncharacterized protein n=1 Tax=Penicillium alfredii TaxID=1506179 RepID=A0A9W9KDC3_9EURO|nr:uncharacterized protein NUU61_004416 [Penicillium alfredii]KAJ5102194.1 hypothetical protein NUU61_004416 [Penicillium alfredii]